MVWFKFTLFEKISTDKVIESIRKVVDPYFEKIELFCSDYKPKCLDEENLRFKCGDTSNSESETRELYDSLKIPYSEHEFGNKTVPEIKQVFAFKCYKFRERDRINFRIYPYTTEDELSDVEFSFLKVTTRDPNESGRLRSSVLDVSYMDLYEDLLYQFNEELRKITDKEFILSLDGNFLLQQRIQVESLHPTLLFSHIFCNEIHGRITKTIYSSCNSIISICPLYYNLNSEFDGNPYDICLYDVDSQSNAKIRIRYL